MVHVKDTFTIQKVWSHFSEINFWFEWHESALGFNIVLFDILNTRALWCRFFAGIVSKKRYKCYIDERTFKQLYCWSMQWTCWKYNDYDKCYKQAKTLMSWENVILGQSTADWKIRTRFWGISLWYKHAVWYCPSTCNKTVYHGWRTLSWWQINKSEISYTHWKQKTNEKWPEYCKVTKMKIQMNKSEISDTYWKWKTN